MSELLARLKRRLRQTAGVHYRKSYAQCGEDMIVRFVFDSLGRSRVRYLDLGAHHPTYLNNTYALYCEGSRGVNVDASAQAIERFRSVRPGDVNLRLGVGPEPGELVFHEMSVPTLSTFSAEQAKLYEKEGTGRVVGTERVEVKTFHDIVNSHFDSAPDFVSIDLEGMDTPVLNSIDFSSCRPTMFCIETLTYSASRQGQRITVIDELMQSAGYLRYADTHVNTLYVDESVWRGR